MENVFCTQCGQLNAATDKYCVACAHPLPVMTGKSSYTATPTPPAERPYFANDPGGPEQPSGGSGDATILFTAKPTQREGSGFDAPYNPEPQSYNAPYNPEPQSYNAPYNPEPQSYGAPPTQMWPPPQQQPPPPVPMPYAPPGYQGVDSFGLPSYAAYTPPAGPQLERAGRGERFVASIIDGFGSVLLIGGMMLLGLGLDSTTGNRDTFSTIFMVLGYLAILGIQGYLLTTQGQSFGKKMLGLRIVKEQTGQNDGFVTNVLLRTIVPAIIGQVTCGLFTLVDVLFIFSDDEKCLHDKMAGTIVVKAGSDVLHIT